MAKTEFSKGDAVVGKKWSGATVYGILEYSYDDGSHCVLEASSGKRFNVKVNELQLATEEEEKDIKRLFKEGKLKLHEKPETVSFAKGVTTAKTIKKEKEITDEDFDILTEGAEEDELD